MIYSWPSVVAVKYSRARGINLVDSCASSSRSLFSFNHYHSNNQQMSSVSENQQLRLLWWFFQQSTQENPRSYKGNCKERCTSVAQMHFRGPFVKSRNKQQYFSHHRTEPQPTGCWQIFVSAIYLRETRSCGNAMFSYASSIRWRLNLLLTRPYWRGFGN